MEPQLSFETITSGDPTPFEAFKAPRVSDAEFQASISLIKSTLNVTSVTLTVGGVPIVSSRGVFRSFHAVPLVCHGVAIGTLSVLDNRDRSFSDNERRVLHGFARLLAGQIDLRSRSHNDPLTGAMSRVAFSQLLRQRLAFHRRNGTAMSLLLLEIDWAEQVQIVWGRRAFDAALVAMVRSLGLHLAGDDDIARIGDDAFAILIEQADVTVAADLAERLRRTVEHLLIPGFDTLALSASIGVCEASRNHATIENWVDQACIELQKARTAGGNRVRIAPVKPA